MSIEKPNLNSETPSKETEKPRPKRKKPLVGEITKEVPLSPETETKEETLPKPSFERGKLDIVDYLKKLTEKSKKQSKRGGGTGGGNSTEEEARERAQATNRIIDALSVGKFGNQEKDPEPRPNIKGRIDTKSGKFEKLNKEYQETIKEFSRAIAIGILTEEEVEAYKEAEEAVKQLKTEDPNNPAIEDLDKGLRIVLSNFANRINKRWLEERNKLIDEYIKEQGTIVEKADADPEVRKTFITQMREAMTNWENISNEKKAREKKEKEAKKAKEEEERNEKRDRIILVLIDATKNVEGRNKEILDNLKSILSPENYDKLQKIMSETTETFDPRNHEALNQIREQIREYILTSEETNKKTPEDLIPWIQKSKASWSYRTDTEFIFDPRAIRIMEEIKDDKRTNLKNLPNPEKISAKITKLLGQTIVFRVLIGSKERSPIWQAFEKREDNDKKGITQKIIEKRKDESERRKAEKTIIEAMRENPEFLEIGVPILKERRLPNGRTKKEESGETTPVFVKFKLYKNEGGKHMAEIEQLVVPSKTDNPAGQREYQYIKVGTKYNLDVPSSSLPSWLRKEVDSLISRIDNN